MYFSDISQLDEILQVLMTSNFSPPNWFPLGLSLGLPKPTLLAVKGKHGNESQCLQECLSQWLNKVDKVVDNIGLTWDSLATGLKSIGEFASGEKIEMSKQYYIFNELQLFFIQE